MLLVHSCSQQPRQDSTLSPKLAESKFVLYHFLIYDQRTTPNSRLTGVKGTAAGQHTRFVTNSCQCIMKGCCVEANNHVLDVYFCNWLSLIGLSKDVTQGFGSQHQV
jgi:hypothetical protein